LNRKRYEDSDPRIFIIVLIKIQKNKFFRINP
jgi:hypothetical protein